MLVLHVCVLVPTLIGVTTIWAGRAVAPPLFDRKNDKLMIEWPTTASNISILTTNQVESVYLLALHQQTHSLVYFGLQVAS